MDIFKRIASILLAALVLTSCSSGVVYEEPAVIHEEVIEISTDTFPETVTDQTDIDEDGYYYDVEHVVLYLDTYGELPHNFVTKDEARAAGWDGGSVEDVLPDMAIGGDYFSDFDDNIPDVEGVKCYECDIDTHNYKNRGSRRLIYTTDGRYYYSHDHYESFIEIFVENGEIIWDEEEAAA